MNRMNKSSIETETYANMKKQKNMESVGTQGGKDRNDTRDTIHQQKLKSTSRMIR